MNVAADTKKFSTSKVMVWAEATVLGYLRSELQKSELRKSNSKQIVERTARQEKIDRHSNKGT